jgi:acetamidase/formamidase
LAVLKLSTGVAACVAGLDSAVTRVFHLIGAAWGIRGGVFGVLSVAPRSRQSDSVPTLLHYSDVENAEVGDAIALTINDIDVTSVATSTGSMAERKEAFGDDPFVDHRCPECGTEWLESIVEGTGEDAIKCAECGANASSFGFEFGYTVAFDEDRSVGLTMDADAADDLANRANEAMAIPKNSHQHPILLYKSSEMAGTLGHLRPFIGRAC